jgi:hypothetical protein
MWLGDHNVVSAAKPAAGADLLATFDFSGRWNQYSFACLSPAQQSRFQQDFREQLEAVVVELSACKDRDGAAWLAPDRLLPPRPTCGPYRPRSDFHVFVSETYPIARALVPAWLGQRGWMEFPAHRVVAGEAAIAHELVHVLLPNGNRMLAEGLATYLQHKLFPTRHAFPNFGSSFEEMVAAFLRTRFPADPSGALWQMNLDALEKISTPDRMSLRIGAHLIGSRSMDRAPAPEEEKAVYAIVASIVEFLIENPIADDLLTEANFGSLYNSTPLRPLERDSGDPERWQRCYQGGDLSYSFADLTLLWKTYMHFMLFRRPCDGAADAMPIPEQFAAIRPVEKLHQRLHAMVGMRPLPAARTKKKARTQSRRSTADRQNPARVGSR